MREIFNRDGRAASELRMAEDGVFLSFLKNKLEQGETVSSNTLESIKIFAQIEAQKRRRAIVFRRLFSIAAGLAIICLLTISVLSRPCLQDRQIVGTIELLDDELASPDEMDTAEILLAWQDAPYRRIEDEMP